MDKKKEKKHATNEKKKMKDDPDPYADTQRDTTRQDEESAPAGPEAAAEAAPYDPADKSRAPMPRVSSGVPRSGAAPCAEAGAAEARAAEVTKGIAAIAPTAKRQYSPCAVPHSQNPTTESDDPTSSMQNLNDQVPKTVEPPQQKQFKGNQYTTGGSHYQVPLADKLLVQKAKSPKDIPVPVRNRLYNGLARYIRSGEEGRKKVKPEVITRYYEQKASGNLFSFLKEFVADTTCDKITITETHETKLTNTINDKYEWVTQHELYIRHKAYKYDSGKAHVVQLLKNAKAKAMPGRGTDKSLKLYRVWKESSECRNEEDTITQAGSGKGTATGAAATEFVERAVQHHNKRADIHEWHKDKGLTDDEADPDEDTAPQEQNLKQTKQKQ